MGELRDITIVGAGPIGLFGAFYAGLRGMSVRVVDSLEAPGGQLIALYPEKPIYDMPGFPEVLAKDLASEMLRQANRFSPELRLGQQCLELTREGSTFWLTTTLGRYPSKAVVVCSGIGAFNPTKIGAEGEAAFLGKGLTYGVQDVGALTDLRVVIVGGGDSALDWALALEGRAKSVTLVHRRDKFRAHEDSVERLYASTICLRLCETVERINGDCVVKSISCKHTQTQEVTDLECDAVVVCIGYKTDAGPIRNWGITMEKNKIRVDEKMQTNIEGVFAAGDVCEHAAKLDLIATGVGEVCIAVNYAKVHIDPSSKAFPGHSSDMALPELR